MAKGKTSLLSARSRADSVAYYTHLSRLLLPQNGLVVENKATDVQKCMKVQHAAPFTWLRLYFGVNTAIKQHIFSKKSIFIAEASKTKTFPMGYY